MTRLVVTGGTGFLGSACVRVALDRGHDVHVVARGPAPLPAGATLHQHDLLRDPPVDLLREVQPTHLLHLAWRATPGVYWTAPENAQWVESSLALLSAFAQFGGTRAVIAGSCAEYDWTDGGLFTEGATPLRPATPYGAAKNSLRVKAEAHAARSGLELAWARLFFLYGPGEHPDRLVPYVIQQLLAKQPALCTEGWQRRDFLHVDDGAAALLALAESDVPGAVNIAAGEAVEVRAIILRLAELCGAPDLVRFGARATGNGDPELILADVSRLRSEVGWTSRIDLEAGLRSTVQLWKERLESGE